MKEAKIELHKIFERKNKIIAFWAAQKTSILCYAMHKISTIK